MDGELLFGLMGVVFAIIGVIVVIYATGIFEYLGGKKRPSVPSISKQALMEKLLALNDPSKPYKISRGTDTDLVAEWKIADASWYGIFNKSGLKKAYSAYLLLDESRHAVRCCEEIWTIDWIVGTLGPTPIVSFQKSFFRGRILYNKEYAKGYGIKQIRPLEVGKVYEYKFDVNEIRGPIIVAVEENGWEWVPVMRKGHASYTYH